MTINRRTVVSASLATGAAMMAGGPVAARAFDAADPSNVMQTYARMRGNGDGKLALWFYTARVWGKPADDVAQVMFTVQGLTYQRLTWRPDGTIDQRMAGRGFYGDPATGAPLDTWTNPYSGETADPPHVTSLALQRVLSDGTLTLAGEDEVRSFFDGRIANHTVNGDTVWLTENFVGRGWPDPARGGAVPTTSSLSTFTAKVADVENESLDFVPCYLNYQSLGTWPGWMKMEDRAAALSWQTWGHKVTGPDQGPREVQAWIERRYPGFLADPGI